MLIKDVFTYKMTSIHQQMTESIRWLCQETEQCDGI